MNKQTDTQKARRFNLADTVIVTVLLLIVALLIKLFIGEYTDYIPTSDRIEYSVEVINADADIAYLLNAGQTVYDSETGADVGTVTGISISNSVYSEYDASSGSYTNFTYPDLLDVTVVISSPYKEADIGYDVNGVSIVTGKPFVFRTESAYAYGNISGITVSRSSVYDMYAASNSDNSGEVTNNDR